MPFFPDAPEFGQFVVGVVGQLEDLRQRATMKTSNILTRDVGKLFQAPINLTTEPAWDVYLLYPPGVKWTDGPPTPHFFMHQLGNRLPQGNRLSGDGLARRVREMLSKN